MYRAENIAQYINEVTPMDVTNREGVAAKEYFGYFHPGLNRECDEPMNSCLNYGYAVVRNAIIKSANASGFLMCWGLFHKNQYNGFNLADDLIEPWRPMVDLVVHKVVGSNTLLTKAQRKSMSDVLNNACISCTMLQIWSIVQPSLFAESKFFVFFITTSTYLFSEFLKNCSISSS